MASRRFSRAKTTRHESRSTLGFRLERHDRTGGLSPRQTQCRGLGPANTWRALPSVPRAYPLTVGRVLPRCCRGCMCRLGGIRRLRCGGGVPGCAEGLGCHVWLYFKVCPAVSGAVCLGWEIPSTGQTHVPSHQPSWLAYGIVGLE